MHRDDKEFVGKWGLRKAFHIGGNSSCRQHLRQHWQLYEKMCKENSIPVNHWAVPRGIWREKKAEKVGEPTEQSIIGFEKITGPREFTREGVLEAVAKLIATDDQVKYHQKLIHTMLITSCQSLALASKAAFRNCLVAMRPKSIGKDIPSTHEVTVYIHNQFATHLKKLKEDILVS